MIATVVKEERRVTIEREFTVVSVRFTEDEIKKLVHDHALRCVAREHNALSIRECFEVKVEPDISWRSETFDGFIVELVYE